MEEMNCRTYKCSSSRGCKYTKSYYLNGLSYMAFPKSFTVTIIWYQGKEYLGWEYLVLKWKTVPSLLTGRMIKWKDCIENGMMDLRWWVLLMMSFVGDQIIEKNQSIYNLKKIVEIALRQKRMEKLPGDTICWSSNGRRHEYDKNLGPDLVIGCIEHEIVHLSKINNGKHVIARGGGCYLILENKKVHQGVVEEVHRSSDFCVCI